MLVRDLAENALLSSEVLLFAETTKRAHRKNSLLCEPKALIRTFNGCINHKCSSDKALI